MKNSIMKKYLILFMLQIGLHINAQSPGGVSGNHEDAYLVSYKKVYHYIVKRELQKRERKNVAISDSIFTYPDYFAISTYEADNPAFSFPLQYIKGKKLFKYGCVFKQPKNPKAILYFSDIVDGYMTAELFLLDKRDITTDLSYEKVSLFHDSIIYLFHFEGKRMSMIARYRFDNF